MLSFRVSHIVATLFHRAIFLLTADVLAGPQWFLINNFTGFIDFIFRADYEYLASYQDLRFTLSGIGFICMWWMVHFQTTKQLWFNGVLLELFILVQILGYLSNLSFSTTNPYHPLLIVVLLHFLLITYRSYMAQLRHLDPEQTFYKLSQLRKPFVPNRALQLIQLTPVFYTVLLKLKGVLDDKTHSRIKYSLGIADAIVYVGINLDLALVVLSRIVGTVREAYREFSLGHLAWMFRVNITGSYTVLVRDIGWRSIAADQLHMSWFIYWLMKMTLVTLFWTQLHLSGKPMYFSYLFQELSSSFVAATATVYFSCLFSGALLTLLAAAFTSCADLVPRSNVIQNCFDTVQHVRWNSFPWKTTPSRRVYLIVYAIMFGHIPLCTKLIQNVGCIVRKSCHCKTGCTARSLGGMLTIVALMTYSFIVFHIMNLTVPNVSKCFAKQLSQQSFIWIIYNCIITLVELLTICIHQGLMEIGSRKNMEKGARAVRTFLTATLALFLTVVNFLGLNDTFTSSSASCGYRDVAHNCVQIVARAAFLYISLRSKTTKATLKQIRNVQSLTYRQKSQGYLPANREDFPCGLCYDLSNTTAVSRLDICGHAFHDRCFASWKSFGHRCPVCRAVFKKSVSELDDLSEDEEDETKETEDGEEDGDEQ